MEEINQGNKTVMINENERLLAILAHVLTFFFGFIAPLVIYLVKKDESYYVTEHAKESLNFQITLAIAYLIGFILLIVLVGILILSIVGLLHLILVVVATIKAADNKLYRYPFSIRFIK
jgi:uncharacterized Tic20 family protein